MPPGFRSRMVAIALVVLLALLRADRGVAELRGRTQAPQEMLRLVTDGRGDWQGALLGYRWKLRTSIPILESGRPLLDTTGALPQR